MRKFVTAALLAAIASIALISTAGARDIPVTLNLIAHETSDHAVNGNRFVITGSLLKASDPSHRKGHFRAVFNRNNRGRAVLYLHNGKIKTDSVTGESRVFRIIGGTRHWDGVSGNMHTHTINRRDTLLTLHVK
jgi:hypothetical protein